jgi:hypothetical protein
MVIEHETAPAKIPLFQQTSMRSYVKLAQRATPLLCGAVGALSNKPSASRLDYWEHNAQDFDIYIRNPTQDHLPMLLREFQSGKQVWPWIWTQPNENGPHHVFVGVNKRVVADIRNLLRDPNNNVLVIASPKELERLSTSDLSHCGVVSDAKVSLMNVQQKILMLDDERVVSFDHLVIS